MQANDSPTIKPPYIDRLKTFIQRRIKPLIVIVILVIAAWWAFAHGIPQQAKTEFCKFVNTINIGVDTVRRWRCDAKPAWYFALVVPGEPDLAREKILRAREIILEEFKNGVDGHPIEITVYDDAAGGAADLVEVSKSNAQKIVADQQALLVIGHFYSPASNAAGPIYQQNEIPAITASSGAPEVTINKPWYFRVLNDNEAMGGYAGLYANQILKYQTASIIYVNTNFGQSLRDAFERAFTAQGGKILYKEAVQQRAELNEAGQRDAKAIVAKFTADKQQPDVIFLAINNKEVFQFVLALEDAGKNYALLDAYDQGDSTFVEWFNTQLQASGRPGHFPDQMYAFSPISYDAAGSAAQDLRKLYRVKYHEEPGWLTATTYDALKVAILAAQETHATGKKDNLTTERQEIKNYLSGWQTAKPEYQTKLTRPLYFDDHHNYPAPPMFGYFKDGRFLSAPIQLSSEISRQTAEAFKKINPNDQPIQADTDKFVFKTNVVYTGIELNEITDVDVDVNHTFTADFFVWFIFDPDIQLNVSDIEFTNAVTPNPLGEAVSDIKLDDGRAYKLYRVRVQFRINAELAYYPFDKQNLNIEFRHKSLSRDYLIYAQDTLGQDAEVENLKNYFESQNVFASLGDWSPRNIEVMVEARSNTSRLGNPLLKATDKKVENSIFGFEIQIARNPARFIVKNLLPLFFLMALTYLALFLPGHKFETVTSLLTGTVLSVVFLHVDLSRRLNVGYIVALDMVFYATYLVLVLELLISVVAWTFDEIESAKNKKAGSRVAARLIWFMRVLYPAYFIIAGAIFLFMFNTEPGRAFLQNFPYLFK